MARNIAQFPDRLQIGAMPDAGLAIPAAPPPNRSGRMLARNSLLNLLGLAAPLLVAVFAIPPVMAGLGAERFGILGLVWVGLSYLGLLDLGLGRATTKYAAEALARGDRAQLASIARVASRMQLVIGVVGGFLVALMVPSLVHDWLRLSSAVEAEASTAFLLMAVAVPFSILANTFRGLLEADQRFAAVNAVRVPISMLTFLLPLVGVRAGWSLGWVVAGLLCARVLALVLFASLAHRAWPELGQPVADAPFDRRRLLGFGGWLTVSSVVSPLLVYGDRFVIGSLVSVGAVGFYTVPHELVTRLDLVPSALIATLFPALAAGIAVEAGDVQRKSVRAIKYVLTLVAPALLALAILSHDLLALWLGPSTAGASAPALRILAIGMIANAVAYVPATLLQAAGRPDVPARFHLLELPIHAGVLLLFIGAWGVTGAALAWSLRVALDAALLLTASHRLGLLRARALGSERLPSLLLLLGVLAIVAPLAASLADHPAARIATVAAVCTLWLGGSLWLAFDGGERSLLRSAFRSQGTR